MVDHLNQSASDTFRIEGKDAQHEKAHVAHAGVGDQAFHILLRHGDQSPVNHPDDGQDGNEPDHIVAGHRQ